MTGVELIGRQCGLLPYEPTEIPGEFRVDDEIICNASPDSTWAVTRERFDAARRSILIGIYDFTAVWVRDALLAARLRGVAVTVMLDLDRRKGEPELWRSLVEAGCECVPAPSCGSESSRYFPSSHEKVVVVDGEWCLVQSGNYTENSVPRNEEDGAAGEAFEPGNRDADWATARRALALRGAIPEPAAPGARPVALAMGDFIEV